ncbi:UbiA family prenyltransferase [Rhodobaculum claviforme]|uniref:Prenyltransferase n=1 Tax=Rhodobaculum claviforme TaxID=1549854 RepID=A0A934WHY0_9RHOB|nr:UbiA family prenyltransferase [Rhodobaculum claviforme]MBK5926324.1 prenyltransferase [Rhodobaculum claviforme]
MINGPVLVVDLDGTLLRSDMLLESFWSATARDPRAPFRAGMALLRGGRAALKDRLACDGPVDSRGLPYDAEVLDHVRNWRAAGGRTALVTASSQRLADQIAAHLDIFDEVHGSDGTTNLKGARKAAFLRDRFGEGGFDYIGDAEADLPVWEAARRAITVTPRAQLRRKVEARLAVRQDAAADTVTHLAAAPVAASAWARALRPHQWLKNALVLVPMLAAHQLTGATVAQSLLAFAVFSLVASSVYLLNDLLDLSADRAHPRKRLRPLASGALPLGHGTLLAPVLLLAGLGLALPLGAEFVLVMVVYYVATLAYSLSLKRKLIIDISLLAGLYTLRIAAGAAATGIELSVWLLAFSIFFFFSLAAVKRQAELVDAAASGTAKAHGRGYQVADLPLVSTMAIASGYMSVLVMALYIYSPEVRALYARPEALWGICLVLLYWVSRMAMVTHRGLMHDDPIVFAVRDRVSLICLGLIMAFGVGGTLL